MQSLVGQPVGAYAFYLEAKIHVKRPHIKLRSYLHSFEPKQVIAISALIDDLDDIRNQHSGYRLYVYELQGCLSYGLLLAAVSVSTGMLELFIRDMCIAYRVASLHGGDMSMRGRIEREIEKDPTISFQKMLKELELFAVVDFKDIKDLTNFYSQTRVPFAHALVLRMTSSPSEIDDDFFLDYFGGEARGHNLEDRLEQRAIKDVQFTVRIIQKYLPWLNRRYNL